MNIFFNLIQILKICLIILIPMVIKPMLTDQNAIVRKVNLV
jgi:hypothetical protein